MPRKKSAIQSIAAGIQPPGNNTVIPYPVVIPAWQQAKIDNPSLTMVEFAKNQGISSNTLRGYLCAHPEIQDEILAKLRRTYQEHSREIDTSVVAKAKKGDPRAAELFYRRLEGWNPQGNQPVAAIQIIINPGMLLKGEGPEISVKSSGPVEIDSDFKQL